MRPPPSGRRRLGSGHVVRGEKPFHRVRFPVGVHDADVRVRRGGPIELRQDFVVDEFLRAQNLGRRDLLPPPIPAALQPPPRLSEKGRAGFADFLAAGPHKAFAMSPQGAWAFRSRLQSAAEAQAKALEECGKRAPNCVVYAVDDALPAKADAAR